MKRVKMGAAPKIDKARIYDRALSADEVGALTSP